jgi:hypothetical protein
MKLKKKWLIGICLGLMVSFAQADTQKEQLELAESYNQQFMQYYQQGEWKKALLLAEKSFKIRKSLLGEKDPDTLTSLNNLAYAYADLGNIDKAVKLLKQFVQGIEGLRKGYLSAKNRQAFFQKWITSYFKLSRLYLIKARPNDAFQTAEMTKARTLLESMTAKLAAQKAGLSTIDLKKLQQNQVKLSAFNQRIAKASELDKKLNLEMEKTQFLKQAAEFHRSLMQKYLRYKQLNDIQIANAKTDASLIPDDALFISYLIHKNLVIVFSLDNTGKLQAYNLGKIPNLDQTLKTYNTVLGEKCPINELHTTNCGQKLIWQIADGSFIIGKKPARNKKPKRIRQLFC